VNACDISETDTKIQSAIWELVTTEVDYIHAIQTVTDVSIVVIYSFSTCAVNESFCLVSQLLIEGNDMYII
jgi:hypothetical protein